MQNLDVISVNLWQILVSLCNLLIIFLILKRFLYQPVKRILTTRQAELDGQYAAAREAQDRAEADRRAWDEKMQTAETEAAQILKKATERADRRGIGAAQSAVRNQAGDRGYLRSSDRKDASPGNQYRGSPYDDRFRPVGNR